jgi:protein NrfC
MNDQEGRKEMKNNGGISRRDFLKYTGVAVVGAGLGHFMISDSIAAIPVSGGYLLFDTKKCQGCMTCMLACSLVNEGYESLSLSRIQVVQNPFEKYPDDIKLALCRQCVSPPCFAVCPTGAIYADSNNGNIRVLDPKKCNGCELCLDVCPFKPSIIIWNPEGKVAQLCDMCLKSTYWKEPGGIRGKQACVEACAVKAIQFTAKIPAQEGDSGYNVNLRGQSWAACGYPID